MFCTAMLDAAGGLDSHGNCINHVWISYLRHETWEYSRQISYFGWFILLWPVPGWRKLNTVITLKYCSKWGLEMIAIKLSHITFIILKVCLYKEFCNFSILKSAPQRLFGINLQLQKYMWISTQNIFSVWWMYRIMAEPTASPPLSTRGWPGPVVAALRLRPARQLYSWYLTMCQVCSGDQTQVRCQWSVVCCVSRWSIIVLSDSVGEWAPSFLLVSTPSTQHPAPSTQLTSPRARVCPSLMISQPWPRLQTNITSLIHTALTYLSVCEMEAD